jgi:hypothetical protein
MSIMCQINFKTILDSSCHHQAQLNLIEQLFNYNTKISSDKCIKTMFEKLIEEKPLNEIKNCRTIIWDFALCAVNLEKRSNKFNFMMVY